MRKGRVRMAPTRLIGAFSDHKALCTLLVPAGERGVLSTMDSQDWPTSLPTLPQLASYQPAQCTPLGF